VEAEAATGGPPRWLLFGQEYLEPSGKTVLRHFKAATEDDRALYDAAAARKRRPEAEAIVPARDIPAAPRSDVRHIIHGVHRYRDLFNERQMLHLSLLGSAIAALPDAADRELFGLAFSEHLATNSMYTAYAFGYRRVSPIFSIHGYRHITRPVELNPWLSVGRGTFPNAVRKMERAIAFARRPSDFAPGRGRRPATRPVGPPDGRVAERAGDVVCGTAGAAVVTRSSADLGDIMDGTVDLVLTDPPYLDNISYSELSDFYLAWHQTLGIARPPYHDRSRPAPIGENLATLSRHADATARYRDVLSAVFSECRRALRPGGLCVFTYHHRSVAAWHAVGEALARSGLRCTAVVPMRGEGQGGLHSFAGTIKWDAVIVCRPGDVPGAEEAFVTPQKLEKAARAAMAWRDRLGPHPRIGFLKPDVVNLYRALIACSATCEPTDGFPLSEALRFPLNAPGD
jgi:hypothetical protein